MNRKPEKIIEAQVRIKAKEMGFDLTVVESKAVYSEKIGRYKAHKTTSEPMPDLVGNYNSIACYIELKAKGKKNSRTTTNKESYHNQYRFLERKIKQGCFACVTDDASYFEDLFNKWINLNLFEGIELLLKDLPKPTFANKRIKF